MKGIVIDEITLNFDRGCPCPIGWTGLGMAEYVSTSGRFRSEVRSNSSLTCYARTTALSVVKVKVLAELRGFNNDLEQVRSNLPQCSEPSGRRKESPFLYLTH
jgi:hypothetical protein